MTGWLFLAAAFGLGLAANGGLAWHGRRVRKRRAARRRSATMKTPAAKEHA